MYKTLQNMISLPFKMKNFTTDGDKYEKNNKFRLEYLQ